MKRVCTYSAYCATCCADIRGLTANEALAFVQGHGHGNTRLTRTYEVSTLADLLVCEAEQILAAAR